MKTHLLITLSVLLINQLCGTSGHAQTLLVGSALVPSNPNSTESIAYVRPILAPFCGRQAPYHRVTMANNNITITFGPWRYPDQFTLAPPNTYVDSVDLGRLLPGDYSLTTATEGPPCPFGPTPPELNKFSFKVTDGRARTTRSQPTLDYSGHWWDEADSGWGLFIWQDGEGNTLAAWMTYTSDGKPAWYVFQPVWEQQNYTRPVDVWQTSKPPGATSPPPGLTKLTPVGQAAIAFYFGNYSRGSGPSTVEQFASFSYVLGSAGFFDKPTQTQTRRLARFKAK